MNWEYIDIIDNFSENVIKWFYIFKNEKLIKRGDKMRYNGFTKRLLCIVFNVTTLFWTSFSMSVAYADNFWIKINFEKGGNLIKKSDKWIEEKFKQSANKIRALFKNINS